MAVNYKPGGEHNINPENGSAKIPAGGYQKIEWVR